MSRYDGPLSPREHDVLRLLCQGRTRKQAAVELGMAQGTVRTHIQNILAKLHLGSQIQAVAYAFRTGLVDPSLAADPPSTVCPACGCRLQLLATNGAAP